MMDYVFLKTHLTEEALEELDFAAKFKPQIIPFEAEKFYDQNITNWERVVDVEQSFRNLQLVLAKFNVAAVPAAVFEYPINFRGLTRFQTAIDVIHRKDWIAYLPTAQ